MQGIRTGSRGGMNCHVCGRPAPEDEMIQFEGRWVCAVCKPAFVQQLKEGCLPPVADVLPEGFHERILGFGALASLSWRLLRRDWQPIAAFALLTALPINLVLLATGLLEAESMIEVGRQIRILGLLEALIGILGSLGIAKIVSERLEGREIGFGGALGHACRRWLAGMGTTFLGNITIGLLLLLLIVPGLIWMGYYSFSAPVVSLRDKSGSAALDHSKSLVRGRWWLVIGRLLCLGAISLVPIFCIELGAAFAPASQLLSFGTSVLSDLCYSYLTVGTVVLFLNADATRSPQPVF